MIIEGIHGLNEDLTRLLPQEYKYRIFISPLTTLNLDDHNIVRPEDLRLLRRMVRDRIFRGQDFESTLDMWKQVRRGEYKYILPYQESADIMFNSTLLYEPVILKKLCLRGTQKTGEGQAQIRSRVHYEIFKLFCIVRR